MGPSVCPETSVRHNYSTLRKIQKELGSHLQRGGSLKSRKITVFWSVMPCNVGGANVPDERVVSVSEVEAFIGNVVTYLPNSRT